MKSRIIFLALVLLMAGCSGEPAPTVGDAEISKGIARKPMPKPPADLAAKGRTARDLAQLRQSQRR